MISMSVVRSLSISSLRRITNSVQYESFENRIYSIVDGNSWNHFFHDDFNVCGTFWKILVNNESQQISFCQNTLGKRPYQLFVDDFHVSSTILLVLALYDWKGILSIMSHSKTAF